MALYNGVMYRYVHSLQGDILGLCDGAGNLVVQYYYDAWGRQIAKYGTLESTLGTLNPLRYRGYVYDEDLGLYYLRSRYYSPWWGRFLSADSVLGQVGGLLQHNLWAYCLNNPVLLVDSNGMSPQRYNYPRPQGSDIEYFERDYKDATGIDYVVKGPNFENRLISIGDVKYTVEKSTCGYMKAMITSILSLLGDDSIGWTTYRIVAYTPSPQVAAVANTIENISQICGTLGFLLEQCGWTDAHNVYTHTLAVRYDYANTAINYWVYYSFESTDDPNCKHQTEVKAIARKYLGWFPVF